ncbi:MAG: NAD-dependent epimerase/dehydratase family protein [Bacteroidales bacterium]|nr:NAD-dependent epimerase/dehydratase family protein [Bacteroidales bacterium]
MFAWAPAFKKLVHVSSIASLGKANQDNVVTESSVDKRLKGKSYYSISKYKGEMEVWRGMQEGLQAIVVNPSVILGPGIWHEGSGKLFKRVNSGLSFYFNGHANYVDVRDVVKFMVLLMKGEKCPNEKFILNAHKKG